jgi:hypothetical protein
MLAEARPIELQLFRDFELAAVDEGRYKCHAIPRVDYHHELSDSPVRRSGSFIARHSNVLPQMRQKTR